MSEVRLSKDGSPCLPSLHILTINIEAKTKFCRRGLRETSRFERSSAA